MQKHRPAVIRSFGVAVAWITGFFLMID